MISQEAIEAYNTRLTVDTSNAKKLTPSQRDTVKHYGSQAEALLKNRELAMFIHHYKFEITDSLANLTGHSPDDNAARVALANNLSGIDGFVTSLKRAIYHKNKLLAAEQTQQPD
jgi:hypothetical protein